MILKDLKPRKALNKAFLKVKPNRTEIESFKNLPLNLSNQTTFLTINQKLRIRKSLNY